MSPFKSTGSISVGKLLSTFRNRDSVGATRLNSSIETDRTPRVLITTTDSDSINPVSGAIYVTWLTSGAFTVAGGSILTDYLLIGGGGGGAGYSSTPPNGYYGGTTGGDSTALGLTAYGGGGAGGYNFPAGKNGGSGGGGGNSTAGQGLNPSTPAPVLASFPAYTPGTTQGYPGVDGNYISPSIYVGGGGGGAGSTGSFRTGGSGKAAFSGDTDFPASYGESGSGPGRYFAGGGAGTGAGPGNKGASSTGGVGGGGNSFPYPSPPSTYLASLGAQGMGGGGGSMFSSPYTSGGAGGGGAGGYLEGTDFAISEGSYPIVIGAGGAGSGPTPYAPPRGIGEGGSGIFVLRIPAPVVSTNKVTVS